MTIFEFDEVLYDGLQKIISGGQNGVDIAGLKAAHDCGFNTGGHCPRFFKTCSGPNLELGGIYGLTETYSTGYQERTRLNVQNSDGTIIIASNFMSPGTIQTQKFITRFNKPSICIKIPFQEPWLERQEQEQTITWLMINKIAILNVAGNRDKDMRYGEHFYIAYYFLSGIFNKYQEIYK